MDIIGRLPSTTTATPTACICLMALCTATTAPPAPPAAPEMLARCSLLINFKKERTGFGACPYFFIQNGLCCLRFLFCRKLIHCGNHIVLSFLRQVWMHRNAQHCFSQFLANRQRTSIPFFIGRLRIDRTRIISTAGDAAFFQVDH